MSDNPITPQGRIELGAAICWLRLLAKRFRDEWPQVACAAADHATKLEAVLETLPPAPGEAA